MIVVYFYGLCILVFGCGYVSCLIVQLIIERIRERACQREITREALTGKCGKGVGVE